MLLFHSLRVANVVFSLSLPPAGVSSLIFKSNEAVSVVREQKKPKMIKMCRYPPELCEHASLFDWCECFTMFHRWQWTHGTCKHADWVLKEALAKKE